jgi:hypothetical protein
MWEQPHWTPKEIFADHEHAMKIIGKDSLVLLLLSFSVCLIKKNSKELASPFPALKSTSSYQTTGLGQLK